MNVNEAKTVRDLDAAELEHISGGGCPGNCTTVPSSSKGHKVQVDANGHVWVDGHPAGG